MLTEKKWVGYQARVKSIARHFMVERLNMTNGIMPTRILFAIVFIPKIVIKLHNEAKLQLLF
ncbi:MAG: hypothetical protein ACLFUC_11730 [Bacteroidales bacterium]